MRHTLRAAAFGLALAGLPLLGVGAALAGERSLPVPTLVIYPGDVIRDSLLVERDFAPGEPGLATAVDDLASIVGKVARRTLLPGKPIPSYAVAEPKVVSIGAQVKVVFQDGGLIITAYAAALQAGGVGDIIRVRNPESGLIISGTVQADGSVRVSDS